MNFTANSKFSVLYHMLFDRSAHMQTGDTTHRHEWQSHPMYCRGRCLPRYTHMHVCHRQRKWSLLPWGA